MALPHTARLLEIIHILRSPGGCPWDRQQTLTSAARYTVDEAGELLDAALAGDQVGCAEELGDLLFMVAFCCEIFAESSGDGFEAAARRGSKKLIRRHPHVFGDAEARDQDASQEHWNAVKAQEKRERGLDPDRRSLLRELPAGSSPLRQAQVYQADAAAAGFDWPDTNGVWQKIDEELSELREAATGNDPAAVRHEVGDVLLAVVNLARKLGVEADDALRLANQRFRRRFAVVEDHYERDAAAMRAAGLDALDALWREAKRDQATSPADGGDHG